jgi:hypothetical protein
MRSNDAASDQAPASNAGTAALLWIGIAAALGLLTAYRLQPDRLAALTVIPAWCWAASGVAATAATMRFRRRLAWKLCALAWAVFVAFGTDQAPSMARSFVPPQPPPGESLRVVSLNCHVGSPEVLDDLRAQHPDLVLLQESPARHALEELARDLYGERGSVVWSGDCSIIANGPLVQIPALPGARYVQAEWESPLNRRVVVASLRLTPPPFRFDWHRPECWSAYRASRELHRRQIEQLAARLPTSMPAIVGGDFNAPAGDGALQALDESLDDAFLTAGRGWGCTISSRLPFHRIDQIWVSAVFEPWNVVVRSTPASDHRMVVCDLRARDEIKRAE